MNDLSDMVLAAAIESAAVKRRFFETNVRRIVGGAELLAACLTAGGKILLFGNGGSAADAQHMAAEFVNRFRLERRPLAAIALTTDTSILTSIGNDYDFAQIFAKQVQALGRAGDVAIGISTSGNSPNVLAALAAARDRGLHTLGIGGPAGRLAEICDLAFCVAADSTARIQETHITLMHVLCELVDRILFSPPPDPQGRNS
jgi:D-sedoheptulose 7-phosphate isomerase